MTVQLEGSDFELNYSVPVFVTLVSFIQVRNQPWVKWICNGSGTMQKPRALIALDRLHIITLYEIFPCETLAMIACKGTRH